MNITIPTLGAEIPALTVNGWIMIQQRLNSSFNFTGNWARYKNGFGSIYGSYWMGNEFIYRLTSSQRYKLRFEMLTTQSVWISAEYDYFVIGNEANYYRLHVSGFSGDCKDALQY